MRARPARAAITLGLAVAVAACRGRPPETSPVPSPQGQPPSVQVPVGSEPLDDAPPTTQTAVDPQLRRFDVVAVGDTTFTILIGAERWVRRGTTGIAVDPKRRDALVARFRILSRVGDSATALITGQTTRVTPTHVALLRQPVPGPLSQEAFWTGIFLGAAAGVAAALLVRR